MSNNQGNPVRESQLGAGAVNTTGQSDDSSIGTPPASDGSTDATQTGVTASSLSERSLPTSFIVLWEGKIASVARILTSKRPPSALSSEKTRSLRQTASSGNNLGDRPSGNNRGE